MNELYSYMQLTLNSESFYVLEAVQKNETA